MKKYIGILLLTIVLIGTSFTTAFAEYYKVNLTRIDQDLYKDTDSNIYFQTMYCYEYCYYEDVIFNDEANELIFDSGSKYTVAKIFK